MTKAVHNGSIDESRLTVPKRVEAQSAQGFGLRQILSVLVMDLSVSASYITHSLKYRVGTLGHLRDILNAHQVDIECLRRRTSSQHRSFVVSSRFRIDNRESSIVDISFGVRQQCFSHRLTLVLGERVDIVASRGEVVLQVVVGVVSKAIEE